MRAEIARLSNELYEEKFKPEGITGCDGCRTEGNGLSSWCKQCEIRACARERKLENCAYCPDYTCGKLESFLAKAKEAKARLDVIRSAIAP